MPEQTFPQYLRALADRIEQAEIEVTRFAACGDVHDVILNLRVKSKGDLLVLAINQPNATAFWKQSKLEL